MVNFGAKLIKRLEKYSDVKDTIKRIADEVNKEATIEAVRVATENTPPNTGKLAGVGARAANMAPHWALDSRITPVNWQTVLANNMQYASYVNDGHRVDKHFVPGLIVNGPYLEKAPAGDNSGIMVGVRTDYVKGLHMKEKAIKQWRKVVRTEMDKRLEGELK